MAYSYSYTNDKGVKETNTTWYDCTQWLDGNKDAKIVDYLKKGTKILIEGVVSPDTYKNKEGRIIGVLRMNVQHITLAGTASDKNDASASDKNDAYASDKLNNWVSRMSPESKENLYSYILTGGTDGTLPDATKNFINALSDNEKQLIADAIEKTLPSAIEKLEEKDDLPY